MKRSFSIFLLSFCAVVLSANVIKADTVTGEYNNFNYENGPKWVVPPYVTQDFDNVIANVIRGSQTVPGAGVSFWGGLIQAKSGSTTNIKNSNFNNSKIYTNIANDWSEGANGGVLYVQRNDGYGIAYVSIAYTNFNNNLLHAVNSSAFGGVIANEGVINTIQNSVFNKNSVTSGNSEAKGGAIANGMYKAENNEVTPRIDKILNTTFAYNTAGSFGGAIYNSLNSKIGDATSSDTGIIKNTTDTITVKDDNNADVVVGKGDFVGNSAEQGGAIYNAGTVTNIEGVTFKGNTATIHGGAIYNSGTIGEIKNSTFTGNKTTGSTDSYGGVIYDTSANDLTFTNVSFIDNVSAGSAGAIYNQNGGINLRANGIENSNTLIRGNKSYSLNTSWTQDIAIWTNGNINIDAKNGGMVEINDAIAGSGYNINIGQGANNVSDNLGVVKLTGDIYDNPSISLDKVTLQLGANTLGKTTGQFNANSGVIDLSYDDEAKEYNLATLQSNADVRYKIDILNSSSADSIRVDNTNNITSSGTVTIGDIDIRSNGITGVFQILKGEIGNLVLALADDVKRIGNNVSAVMSSDSFVGNIVELAKSSGSAVYDSIKLSLIDPFKAWAEYDTTSDKTFSVNADMTLLEGITSISGSKILLTGDNSAQKRKLNVNSVNFLSNQAQYKDITLRDLIISNIGSHIYNDGKLTISNVEFRNNNSGSNAGGVIYNYGGAGLSISDSVFDNNGGGTYGGAICNTGYGYISSINSATFSNNSATYGGALENGNRVIDSINGVNFVKNTATEGGAIKNTGTISDITNTNFSSNTATTHGGAIFNDGNNAIVNISGTEFTGNRAILGGAIYNNGGTMNLTNVTMTGNVASGIGGGAIYNNGGTLNIMADNGTTSLSGNMAYNGATNIEWHKIGIYSNSASSNSASFSIDAKNNGVVEILDDIAGSGYNINIGNNSDNTGNVKLTGKLFDNPTVTLKNVALEIGTSTFEENTGIFKVESGSINMADDSANEYKIGNLQSNENANWNLDVKLDNNGNAIADTINIVDSASGIVNLTSLNIADMNPLDDQIVKIQILKGNIGTLGLKIDGQVKLVDKAVAQMSTSNVLAKSFGLATSTSTSTYDSIEIAGARNVLAAWTELDTSDDKIFTLNDSVVASRDVSGLMGTNIRIAGSSGQKKLDLNNTNMLSSIGASQNLALDNVKVVNAKNNLITNEGSLKLSNSTNVISNVTNNKTLVMNDTAKVTGNVANNLNLEMEGNALISGLLTNNGEAVFDDNASVSGGVVNNGTLTLSENAVVSGGLTNNVAITRTPNVVNVDDDAIINNGLTNNDTVNLNDNAQVNGDVVNAGDLNVNDSAKVNDNVTNTGNLNVFANAKVKGDIVNNGAGVVEAKLSSLEGNIENNATFNILGGDLTKNITGNGVNVVKNDVIINGGSFSYDGDLEVATNATLDIGTNKVEVDNAVIKGNLKLKVDNISAYSSNYEGGQILVNSADISGAKAQFTVAQGLLSGRQVTGDLEIIALKDGASGDIVGDYASIFEENNRYVIENGSKDGSVVIRNTNSASDVVKNSGIGNRNNMNTAQAWDTALLNGGKAKEMQNILNELSQHNKQRYVKALNGVAPSDNQLALNTTRQLNNLLSREVMRHYEEDGCSCGNGNKPVSSWVQTIGMYSKQDTRMTTTGYSAQTTGLILGFDGAVDCDTKVGFGYANYRTDADSSYRDTEINGHTLFAYAKYQPSFWYARGLISYSMSDFEERANVEGINVSADYDAHSFGLESALGYEYLNGIVPEVGMKYTYVTSDDYSDSLGQNIDTEGVDVLTLEARVKYEPRWGLDDEYDLRPRAYVGVGYDVVNGKRTTDVNISDMNYDIFVKDMPRLGFEAGVALEGSVGDLDVSVGYDVDFRRDYQNHTGMIKLRYNF